MFSDNIKAWKESWMLGDEFLREMFTSLKTLQSHLKEDDKSAPYIFQHYNVMDVIPPKLSNVRSFLARIINAMVNMLNRHDVPYLPRYLMIFLDKDLITNARVYDFGVTQTFEDTLKWLLININQMIEV